LRVAGLSARLLAKFANSSRCSNDTFSKLIFIP